MKIAITADIQFDEYLSLSTLLPNGLTSRLRDVIDCFKWIVSTARDEGCTALILAGDIFDCRTSIEINVIHAVCDVMRWASSQLALYILAGNHDSHLRSPRLNSVQMFQGYARVIDRAQVVAVGDHLAMVGFVPWHEDRDDFKAGVDAVIRKNAEYLVSHVLLETVTPSGKGLPVSMLRASKFKGVFLGDVHEPQKIKPNIQYVGAPLQLNYGDADRKRGFVILDPKTNKTEFIENEASPQFHIVRGSKIPAIVSGDFVRIENTDVEVAEKVQAEAKQLTDHVEARFVKLPDLEPRINVTTRDSQSDAIQKYCEHHKIDDEETIALGLAILEEARGGRDDD